MNFVLYIYIYDSRHCHFKKATGLWEQPWSELHGDSDGLCQPSFLCPHIHSHCVSVPDRHQWQHATVPAPRNTVLSGGERSQWDICREHYCHRQGQWQVWRDYLLPAGHKWWPESHHWLQNSMFSFCPKHPVNLNSIYLTIIFLVINTWLSIP